jgi:hypothetical protein
MRPMDDTNFDNKAQFYHQYGPREMEYLEFPVRIDANTFKGVGHFVIHSASNKFPLLMGSPSQVVRGIQLTMG